MKFNTDRPLQKLTLSLSAMCLLSLAAQAENKKSSLNSDDAIFVKEEAAAGIAAVKIAELGAKKAHRQEVKSFAAMMVAEHAKANAELKTLAASKGIELSSVIEPKHAETYQELEQSSGAEFDKEFLSEMQSGLKTVVANFEEASKDSVDGDLKSWVNKMLPVLKSQHSKMEGLTTSTSVNKTTEPDNTARNARDRNDRNVTPMDQSNEKSDIQTTAQVRREVMAKENMSTSAKNVKIITNQGRITLRGPVKTAEEKRLIGEIASRLVTVSNVDNQLEVISAERN
jgi:putative membrane protein